MVSFGVPRLDDAFADQTGPILIANEPGVDARPFLLQAAARELAAGGHVVFATTDRAPDRLLDALADFGAPSTRRLTILDGYSSLQGIPDAAHAALEVRDLDTFLAQIAKAHKSHPTALFLLDSINGLHVRAGADQLERGAHRLMALLERFPGAIAAYTKWDHDLDALEAGFPHLVRLQAVQERIVTSQYFRIGRVAGKDATEEPILYRSEEGSVRVYVPKVVVTGPADAGKSTFVHAVSDHAVSADRAGATVALDRGTLDRAGIQVELFGTPGQERFDPMIGPILRQAVGVVLVLDSTRPESFERAAQMFDLAWRHGVHAVVAANKQDLEGALDVQQVQQQLRLPENVPIIACQATDPAAATAVLDGLLQRILERPEVPG